MTVVQINWKKPRWLHVHNRPFARDGDKVGADGGKLERQKSLRTSKSFASITPSLRKMSLFKVPTWSTVGRNPSVLAHTRGRRPSYLAT